MKAENQGREIVQRSCARGRSHRKCFKLIVQAGIYAQDSQYQLGERKREGAVVRARPVTTTQYRSLYIVIHVEVQLLVIRSRSVNMIALETPAVEATPTQNESTIARARAYGADAMARSHYPRPGIHPPT